MMGPRIHRELYPVSLGAKKKKSSDRRNLVQKPTRRICGDTPGTIQENPQNEGGVKDPSPHVDLCETKLNITKSNDEWGTPLSHSGASLPALLMKERFPQLLHSKAKLGQRFTFAAKDSPTVKIFHY